MVTFPESIAADQLRKFDALGRQRHSAAKADFVEASAGEAHPTKKCQLASALAGTKNKRIRQSAKPLMNKLEREFFNILNVQELTCPRPRAQAKKYKLANGAFYLPDITSSNWPVDDRMQEAAWEIKGGRGMKGAAKGTLTIKFAAAAWPEVAFFFCTKENGVWSVQRIIP
jgi:hypothetical protein